MCNNIINKRFVVVVVIDIFVKKTIHLKIAYK